MCGLLTRISIIGLPFSAVSRPNMRIFHEESFGPVASIIKVRDHEEALEIANATDHGLSSAVITNNMQKALDLAFGMVHLNDCTVRTSRTINTS